MAKKTTNKTELLLETGDKRVFKRADNFNSYYVNNTTFGYTRFDFQIVFGRVEISRDESHDYTSEVATIVMTPEYAKALLTDFARVLAEYENKHGEISIRPDITQ